MELMLFRPPSRDDAAILLACGQHVADEEQVELATFGGLRGTAIVVDAGDAAGVDRGMPPAGNVMTGGIDEQAEMHLPRHGARSANWLRGRRSIRCSRNVLPA